jgi:hypothetical protein
VRWELGGIGSWLRKVAGGDDALIRRICVVTVVLGFVRERDLE